MARKPNEEVQLKLRFSEALRRQLERAAKTSDSSMNAEIIRRLEQSFEWDAQFESVKKFVADTKASMDTALDAHMRAKGFTPVSTIKGPVWLSPGMDPLDVAVWTDPNAFQQAQEEAMRAIFREISRDRKGE